MYIFLLPIVIVTLLTLPVLSRIKHFSDGKKAQRAIIGNICTFFGIMILAVALPIGGFVSAEVTEEAADVLTNAAGLGSTNFFKSIKAFPPLTIVTFRNPKNLCFLL